MVECKSPFHVGDRVVCTNSVWGVEVGELGTICFVNPDYNGDLRDIGVRWDMEDNGGRPVRRHDCDGHCEIHHGLWYYEDDMALYAENEELEDMSESAFMSILF